MAHTIDKKICFKLTTLIVISRCVSIDRLGGLVGISQINYTNNYITIQCVGSVIHY